MRSKRARLFRIATCIAVLTLLFGVAAAYAAGPDERVSKEPGQIHRTWHFKSVNVGKSKGQPSFFKDELNSGCSSGWSRT